LSKLPDGLLYSGFSPRESEWEDLLHHYNVGRVIVSKYEAWPALWAAASEQHAPLVVINAQTRSSLTWVKRFLKWFHVPLPHLFFSCVGPEQQNEVQVQFPTATVLVHSDPRWVRAISRAKIARENGAVQSILTELSSEKQKPYCLVGSAWLADLKKIAPAFQKIPGTLWVVPHSLKAEGLAEMEAYLAAMLPGRYELVARMGVLLELYSLADCAWVGGGFGEGIHSTLEPAVFQIPIACGPKNVEKFLETRELRDAQMLTVCRSTEEIQAWLQKSMQMNGVKKTEHDLLSPENKLRDFEQLVDDCLRTV
jgi:3-deoxy-D-manno-octulosonic-acid transferase